jgi:hypothetical protein
MRKYVDTVNTKSTEDNSEFWGKLVPAHMEKLEALLSSTPGDGFTSSGSVGESPCLLGQIMWGLIHNFYFWVDQMTDR